MADRIIYAHRHGPDTPMNKDTVSRCVQYLMMFDLLGLTHLGSLGKDCHAVVDEVVVLKPEAPARFEGRNDGHTEVVIQLRNTSGNPSVQPFPTG